MTATPTSEVIAPQQGLPQCPPWCQRHLTSDPGALLHLCDLGESWGATPIRYGEEKISITLEQHDDDGVPGEPYLSFRYSIDGRCVDQAVDLPLPVAEHLLFAGLSLVAYGRAAGFDRQTDNRSKARMMSPLASSPCTAPAHNCSSALT